MSDLGSGWYIMTGNQYLAGPFTTDVEARETKQSAELPGRVGYLELGRFIPQQDLAL